MPLSGGYFYPGINGNVSAGVFHEVSIKERGDLPDVLTDHGFLFVSGTGTEQQLYFRDETGEVTAIAPSTASIDFSVVDELDLRGVLTSSTNNNQAKFSSSIDFLNDDPDFHLNARNTHLILSSSAGSHVVVSGSLFATEHLDVGTRSSTITIGGATLNSKVNVHTEGATDLGGLLLHRHTNNAAFGAHFIGARSRGTEASPTVVQVNDKILRLVSVGYDGTDYGMSAQIEMTADGGFDAANSPGRISFYTTPTGSQTEIERYRINSIGEFVAPLSHMILSSSVGSTIAISGNTDVKDNDIININSLKFKLTASHVHDEGSVYWSEIDKTLNIDTEINNVVLQVGQEQYLRAINKTGIQIDNGQIVYISGAQGNRPAVTLADNATGSICCRTIGVATHDILNDRTGYIATFGLVRELNTTGTPYGETWSEGEILYVGNTSGSITNILPVSPNFMVKVGYVINAHISEGIIFVDIDNGMNLEQISNVLTSSTANNDILYYDSITDSENPLWKNIAISNIPYSASLNFGTINQADVVHDVGDLILSSSTTSRVYISGNLEVGQDLIFSSSTSGDATYVPRDEWLHNGFFNPTEVSMSWDDTNRELVIQPIGDNFQYYLSGTIYTETNPLTGTITDTEGFWILYFSDESTISGINTPTGQQISEVIQDFTPIAYIYWDATNNIGRLMYELHGSRLDPITHNWLHFSIGSVYGTGMALSDFNINAAGNDNIDAQFSVAVGTFSDEDITFSLSSVASNVGLEIWYLDGSNWRWKTNSGFSILTGSTGRMAWNDGGTQADVSNNNFALSHIYATDIVDNNGTNPRYISVQGQNEYSTIISAREGAEAEINTLTFGEFPLEEVIPIATVIFQTSNGYENDVKSKIRSTNAGDNYIDWRGSNIRAAGGSVTEHGALGGLFDDDHAQYALLAGRSGGQVLTGGLDSGDDLTFMSTNNATKGSILFGNSAYDEVNNRLGIGETSPDAPFEVSTAIDVGIQAVTIDQNDEDKPFIDFQGEANASVTASISTHTTAGSVQGFIQVEINGTKRWISFYDDPSA
jgi:hypothetical protein